MLLLRQRFSMQRGAGLRVAGAGTVRVCNNLQRQHPGGPPRVSAGSPLLGARPAPSDAFQCMWSGRVSGGLMIKASWGLKRSGSNLKPKQHVEIEEEGSCCPEASMGCSSSRILSCSNMCQDLQRRYKQTPGTQEKPSLPGVLSSLSFAISH